MPHVENPDYKRVHIRVPLDTHAQMQYWADKEGMSLSEYVRDCVKFKIARSNGDYDLPSLEVARLNQLVDEVKALSVNVSNLEYIVVSGFDTLLGLTRGDNNYLEDDDDDNFSGSFSSQILSSPKPTAPKTDRGLSVRKEDDQ